MIGGKRFQTGFVTIGGKRSAGKAFVGFKRDDREDKQIAEVSESDSEPETNTAKGRLRAVLRAQDEGRSLSMKKPLKKKQKMDKSSKKLIDTRDKQRELFKSKLHDALVKNLNETGNKGKFNPSQLANQLENVTYSRFKDQDWSLYLKGLRGTLASIGDQTNKHQIYDGFYASETKIKQSRIDSSKNVSQKKEKTVTQKPTTTKKKKEEMFHFQFFRNHQVHSHRVQCSRQVLHRLYLPSRMRNLHPQHYLLLTYRFLR